MDNQGNEKTAVGAFHQHQEAQEAVQKLESEGFTDKEVSLIGKEDKSNPIKGGVSWGAGVGGTAGLLAGLGALAIPGIGPLIAAGPIAATLAGGAAGGLMGGLMDYGIPRQSSQRYENEIKEGDLVVVVRASSDRAEKAKQVLDQCGAHDIEID